MTGMRCVDSTPSRVNPSPQMPSISHAASIATPSAMVTKRAGSDPSAKSAVNAISAALSSMRMMTPMMTPTLLVSLAAPSSLTLPSSATPTMIDDSSVIAARPMRKNVSAFTVSAASLPNCDCGPPSALIS